MRAPTMNESQKLRPDGCQRQRFTLGYKEGAPSEKDFYMTMIKQSFDDTCHVVVPHAGDDYFETMWCERDEQHNNNGVTVIVWL